MRLYPTLPDSMLIGMNNHNLKEADDDDTEKDGVKQSPDFFWKDNLLHSQTLDALNQMRKNKHFCDIVLQINKQDLYAHRVVLAAASPYFMDIFNSANDAPTRKETEGSNAIVYEMNGGFEKEAVEKLIEYAYTARLEVSGEQVRSIYLAATRMKMERIARKCAQYLIENMNVESCLELRALPGFSQMNDVVEKVDDFIKDNVDEICEGKILLRMRRICVEVLHNTKQEQELAQSSSLCQLVLDWVHNQWLENQELTLDNLSEKTHLLYMGQHNALHDCQEIEAGSPNDSDIIQDYKKVYQSHNSVQTKKIRRHVHMKPSKPRELLFSRHINQEDTKTEDDIKDWKVIAWNNIEESSIIGIMTIDGHLITCSIMKRLNRPISPSASNLITSLPMSDSFTTIRGNTAVPFQRPPSAEKDIFMPIANMDQARCAEATCLNGKLVVCGGFDRGECLNLVSLFDADLNSWTDLEPMLVKRGRFDVTVKGNSIYAVAGSSGQTETNTAEKYDSETGKWTFIASVPLPISNIGLCNLNEQIYCVGGTYGQTGNRNCFKLVKDDSKWERIASLHTGRSQAGVTSFKGKIWVVGGCDAWNPLSSTEVYDPSKNSWSMGPPLNTPRRGCGLVAIDDLLYAIGGSDGTQSLCTTEVFDPKVNLWVAGPNMTICRGNVSATLVGNKIWAVGGFSGKMFLNSVEFLDPDRKEWTTFLPNDEALNPNDQDDTGNEDNQTGDETALASSSEHGQEQTVEQELRVEDDTHSKSPCDN